MIETDLAHLRFLHERCVRGDRLYTNDIVFLAELEPKIRKYQDMIAQILECLEND